MPRRRCKYKASISFIFSFFPFSRRFVSLKVVPEYRTTQLSGRARARETIKNEQTKRRRRVLSSPALSRLLGRTLKAVRRGVTCVVTNNRSNSKSRASANGRGYKRRPLFNRKKTRFVSTLTLRAGLLFFFFF